MLRPPYRLGPATQSSLSPIQIQSDQSAPVSIQTRPSHTASSVPMQTHSDHSICPIPHTDLCWSLGSLWSPHRPSQWLPTRSAQSRPGQLAQAQQGCLHEAVTVAMIWEGLPFLCLLSAASPPKSRANGCVKTTAADGLRWERRVLASVAAREETWEEVWGHIWAGGQSVARQGAHPLPSPGAAVDAPAAGRGSSAWPLPPPITPGD